MRLFQLTCRWLGLPICAGILVVVGHKIAIASDHLDTPTVIADPAADIGDILSRLTGAERRRRSNRLATADV
jgi:hypothetical protein